MRPDLPWPRLSFRAAAPWLAAGAAALIVANGRWQLATAAWIAPICMRRYLMSQPLGRGLLVGLTVQLSAHLIQWNGIIPAPGALYYLIAGSYGLVYFVPFAVDRSLAPRIPGFVSTLVLPTTWFLTEALVERLTPYGSWAAGGYTQDHLPLLQISSVAGIGGVGFLILWTASVLTWAVASPVPWRSKRTPLAAWSVAGLLVVAAGDIRLAAAPPTTRSVRIAQLTPSVALTGELERAMRPLLAGGGETDALDGMRRTAARLTNDLLTRTRHEARAGARIVVWSEHAGRVFKEEEQHWIDRARTLAREEEIYLFMSLGTWSRLEHPPLENKVVAITPAGEVAWEHQKARPIVGPEAGILPPRHDTIPVLDTPFGRLGAVVCHDLDFPGLIRKAGRQQVDLLFAPSADWPVIATLHARMARARAIENGLTLVRPTAGGVSLVVDPYGRVGSSFLDRGTEPLTLVDQVSIGRARAPHVAVGGALVWIDLVLLAALVGAAAVSGPGVSRVEPIP
jgi:apolipoprotein N-acyltransferase